MRPPRLIQQPSLFGGGEPTFDASFARIQRVELTDGAWLDLCPGWLLGERSLFDHLLAAADWREEKREMYERIVEVPRLCAVAADLAELPPVVAAMQQSLDKRYGVQFERVSLALYRDGADSVAWHGDYVARRLPDAVVATVSLGEPRRFLVRSRAGGRSLAFSLGRGDLLVMGGSCQRTHEHAIPKVARAMPRIALMYRPIFRE